MRWHGLTARGWLYFSIAAILAVCGSFYAAVQVTGFVVGPVPAVSSGPPAGTASPLPSQSHRATAPRRARSALSSPLPPVASIPGLVTPPAGTGVYSVPGSAQASRTSQPATTQPAPTQPATSQAPPSPTADPSPVSSDPPPPDPSPTDSTGPGWSGWQQDVTASPGITDSSMTFTW
jgi:DNA polymerase III subunit gamma/tau